MTTRNLYQIQGMYYFRTRIPVDLRLWFNGQEDFKRSLKTKEAEASQKITQGLVLEIRGNFYINEVWDAE